MSSSQSKHYTISEQQIQTLEYIFQKLSNLDLRYTNMLAHRTVESSCKGLESLIHFIKTDQFPPAHISHLGE